MAIISVSIGNTAPLARRWEMPTGVISARSPIPRGLITFFGSDPIAALLSGNQTAYLLTCTMPEGFVYIPRNINMKFLSDDLTNDFNNLGAGFYVQKDYQGGSDAKRPWTGMPQFCMCSDGEIIIDADAALRIWSPGLNSPKGILLGNDTIRVQLADMSADASTAGDMHYFIELYVFDLDQVDKWELNYPQPVVNAAAFG